MPCSAIRQSWTIHCCKHPRAFLDAIHIPTSQPAACIICFAHWPSRSDCMPLPTCWCSLVRADAQWGAQAAGCLLCWQLEALSARSRQLAACRMACRWCIARRPCWLHRILWYRDRGYPAMDRLCRHSTRSLNKLEVHYSWQSRYLCKTILHQ